MVGIPLAIGIGNNITTITIKDQEMFDKTVEYIHMNPAMAGFVNKPEHWKYSSAIDFCGPDSYRMKGLIELNFS